MRGGNGASVLKQWQQIVCCQRKGFNKAAEIEKELAEKIPALKEGYGYILHSDTGARFGLEIDGIRTLDPVEVKPLTGSQQWRTLESKGIRVEEGVHSLRVVVEQGTVAFESFDFTISCADSARPGRENQLSHR